MVKVSILVHNRLQVVETKRVGLDMAQIKKIIITDMFLAEQVVGNKTPAITDLTIEELLELID